MASMDFKAAINQDIDEIDEALLKEAVNKKGWTKLVDFYKPFQGPKSEGKHSATFLWKRVHQLIIHGFLESRPEPNCVYVRISQKGKRYMLRQNRYGDD